MERLRHVSRPGSSTVMCWCFFVTSNYKLRTKRTRDCTARERMFIIPVSRNREQSAMPEKCVLGWVIAVWEPAALIQNDTP